MSMYGYICRIKYREGLGPGRVSLSTHKREIWRGGQSRNVTRARKVATKQTISKKEMMID